MATRITDSALWQALSELAGTPVDARDLMDTDRVSSYTLTTGQLTADLSRHLVTDEILDLLMSLADEAGVLGRARDMARGEKINTTEGRAVLHMALRGTYDELDPDLQALFAQEHARTAEVSTAIREAKWTGTTGKAFTDVINIGIGGSDLGPKMVVDALREFADGPRCHFLSNVDGAEVHSLLPGLKAESTLVIISSKTFTTTETMTNARTVLDWLGRELFLDNPQASTHCIGITSNINAARKFGIPDFQILTFQDSIGGRYSLWSSIGLVIAIAVGARGFRQLLDGAEEMDRHFLEAEPRHNLPLLMGMLGIWYNNFLKLHTHAVIPYCQRLNLLVDYLQQLDMESNGKSATLDNQQVTWDTGPVIWGQTGTNGQHAFFQSLHQGTHVIPVDFIGIATDNLSSDEHHRILLANMIAQAQALMHGRENENPHRRYPGNRPSTTLLIQELTPRSLGQLIALYEHKVFVQGIVWQINSFDQWGVELSKVLATEILDGSRITDPSTLAMLKRAGLPD